MMKRRGFKPISAATLIGGGDNKNKDPEQIPLDMNVLERKVEVEPFEESEIIADLEDAKIIEKRPELFANCDPYPVSKNKDTEYSNEYTLENTSELTSENKSLEIYRKRTIFSDKFSIGRFICLIIGVVVSLLAGYISVMGIGALFPGGGLLVKAMGAAMEIGKVVLVANLRIISKWSRIFVLSMTVILMSITALGVYGFLSAAHQTSKEVVITSSVQVDTLESTLALLKQKQADAQSVITHLNAVEDVYVSLKNPARAAQVHRTNLAARNKAEADLAASLADQQKLLSQRETAKVITEKENLSPVHYAAQSLGLDEESVVRIVILILMIAFDPLGLMLIAVSTWRKN